MKIFYPPEIGPDHPFRKTTESFFEEEDEEGCLMPWGFKPQAPLVDLIKQGICLDAWDEEGNRPIHLAAFYDRLEVLEALIAAGANLNQRNCYENTPLMTAAYEDHRGVVDMLLAAGAHIETRGKDGYNALLKGVQLVERAALSSERLMDRGANVYVRAKNGLSPIHRQFVSELTISARRAYTDFVSCRVPPESAWETCRLLSVTPLADPYAEVDFVGNLRRIFSHAKWKDKTQAEDILKEMQKDGAITAETMESILNTTFPRERVRPRSKTQSPGAAI